MTQYRAFIQTAEGLGAVARELAAAEASLDSLLADAPALEAAAEGFAKTASALLAARAQNKQLHSEPPDACHPSQALVIYLCTNLDCGLLHTLSCALCGLRLAIACTLTKECGLTPCATPKLCIKLEPNACAASRRRLPRHGAGAAGGAAADGHLRAQRQLRRGAGPAGARAAVVCGAQRAPRPCHSNVTKQACVSVMFLVGSARHYPSSAMAALTAHDIG